jgi:PAS domain S-box-containing protein
VEAAGDQIGGIGWQKVAIDTLRLLCVVGVIETLGMVSWRMAPTSDTRKISGASGSEQESLVEALLEGMGEGFFAFDDGWRLTAANSAAETILGAPSAEVVGALLWNVLPQIRGTEFERRCRLVIQKHTREEFEIYSALWPHRHHDVRAFPFGADVGVAFRDITDRERDTQALRDRQLELVRVQRIGGVGGLDVDLANGFRSQRSPEYLHLHGLPPNTIDDSHERWIARVHPEDRERVEKYFLAEVAGSEREYKAEYRIVRPSDGQTRWIRAVAEIERDRQGRALKLIGAHLDITDQKKAEATVQESEGRLRAIADAIPFLISYLDKDQIFRFINKPYESWFERPLSEIVGRHVREVLGPAMYEVRQPFIERALAGESLSYEADFPRSDGTVQTEIVHVPHRDQAGRTLGLYTVVMDITARKLAERVLSESEERFRSIADSAPVPMWVSRLDGLRQFVNRAYHEFLGVPFADALNFDWRKALHPDDLERILRDQRAGEGSRKPFVLEARYRRHDGQWRWLRSESQPRWGPAGEHIGFIGVAHDITASKEAERALTEVNETLERRIEDRTRQLAASEALIQTFFNHSSECYAVIVEEDDGQFRYAEANPATLRLYKKTRDAVVGRTIQEALGAESASEIGAHLAVCLREGAPHRYERTQGDAIIEAIVTPAPQEPGAPRRVVVSAHDVTERRRLEQQLHQSQKMEAVGQLTGGVAHDFNNLLTLVIGGLDIIGRQIPNLPDPIALTRVERGREMAMQGAQRAASLTTRLLAFSRQQPLNPQALDANKLVVDVCDLLRRAIGEAIAVETALGNDVWRMYADANQLENALLNIGFNARDAMPDGGKLIIETANASLDKAYTSSLNEDIEPGEFVMIAITDTGTGMDMTTQERAFDPFFTTKEVGKGTGLGLSQVYGFARQSAGHVKIYSEIGEGTTVKIYLPRSVSDRKNPIIGEANKLSRWTGAETILVVEDDDELRKYAREVLEELGYHVMSAGSGAAALETLNGSHQIDLLLTDVVMPGGMNGRQLADKAVGHRPGLRVLYMTGYTRNAIIHQGRLDRGTNLISKPFSFEELASKVRQVLDAAG